MLSFIIGFFCGFVLNSIVTIIISKKACKECLFTEMFTKELEGVFEAIQ